MIHIVSAHVDTDLWYHKQIAYFSRFIQQDYRLYLSLPPLLREQAESDGVHHIVTDGSQYYGQLLNGLMETACKDASDDDLVLLFSGDTFPIGDIVGFVKDKLSTAPLTAIQRRENFGELCLSPTFFATKAAFWRSLPGSWAYGYAGHAIDDVDIHTVGGQIQQKLTRLGETWYPIWRSNKRFLHPVWFNVYEDVLYNHGVKFGDNSISTADKELRKQSKSYYDARMQAKTPEEMEKVRTHIYRDIRTRTEEVSEALIEWMSREPDFYKWFMLEESSSMVKPPEFSKYCDHKNTHFRISPRVGKCAVECLDCLFVGPMAKHGDDAVVQFEEANRENTLRPVPPYIWRQRFELDT